MAIRIQFRRDTTANWATANPILASGEPAYDTVLKVLKIGDGTANWVTLPSITDGFATATHTHTISDITGLSGSLASKVDDSQVLTNVPLGAVFTDTVDHAEFDKLEWSDSGHIGDANKVAGFDASGLPVYNDPTKIIPPANSTTAVQIMKADGVTPVMIYDTVNKSIGVNAAPTQTLYLYKDDNHGVRIARANGYIELAVNNGGKGVFTSQAEFAINAGSKVDAMVVRQNTGYVGINTTGATMPLDVNGKTYIRDDFNTLTGKYQYQAASPTADTVNDTRFRNNAGVLTFEKCTVANATKGAGTWVVTLTIP